MKSEPEIGSILIYEEIEYCMQIIEMMNTK